MTDPVRTIDNVHLAYLTELLLKLRGPGVVDPELPPDPSNLSFPEGVRAWAAEQICRLVDEKVRRREEEWTTARTFDDIVYGTAVVGEVTIEPDDG